ncbi:MAG: response regulator, partial [Deltaproteobacteria bacterium]|nr:response regulator [Deltaproteobacteria bacterium]
MNGSIRKSLHIKILLLVVGLISFGVAVSVYWEVKTRERELLEEKKRASAFVAKPVLNAIYHDMLAERADMARQLIKSLGRIEDIKIRIIRNNGVEEAFKDLKTINEVKKTHKDGIRPEWLVDHLDEPQNRAKGIDTAEFMAAFKEFREGWTQGAKFYIDKSGHEPLLTYLQPIERKKGCKECHSGEGSRGILMITTPLSGMYVMLDNARNQWILTGILAIAAGAVLLSLLIKKTVTGPINEHVRIIKGIADGKGGITGRVKVSSGDELGYLATAFNNMLDTLEKREAENTRLFEQVAKSRAEWVATFDAIQDLISIHDRDYKILKVNKALAKKFNAEPEELIGRRCHELFFGKGSPRATCPHAKTIATAMASDTEVDDFVIEGAYKVTTFPVFDAHGEIWATVHIARDITEERFLREHLLHAEKLSSLGKLVAGIAHELNNPLMGILGFSQILMDTPGDKLVKDIKEKLRKIYHESMRTARIVRNLLTFARDQKTERDYIDVNDIVKHTIELKEYSLRANNIKVELRLGPELPRTMVDLYQLQQVFINIINNAEDAMAGKQGLIEIETKKERGNLKIIFKDNGPGIPKEIIHKVFDPFFTTKDVGKGTGLGLSISHGIITEHGGGIAMASPDEGGAIVTITLPIVGKGLWAQIRQRAQGPSTPANDPANNENILVVDDEKSIRDALSAILIGSGFKVVTARDGKEALDALGRAKFSLLVTDIKMAGISGIELYGAVTKKFPYLQNKIIMLTGDVFSQEVRDFLSSTGCPYLLKPCE